MDLSTLCNHLASRAYSDVFEHLRDSDETCPWCFGRVRSFYPEFDDAVADRLGGKKLGGEPALQVIRASSDASPAVYKDVVPPKTDEHGRVVEPARAMSVCECGVIDFSNSDSRSKGQLLLCVRNIAEHLHTDYIPFDVEAAETAIDVAADKRLIGDGVDMEILECATQLGLKKAPKRAALSRQYSEVQDGCIA